MALDVDGTLGDYHDHFLRFAEGWFGRAFPPTNRVNPGLKLWEFMGVGLEEYRHCKLAYRQGGLKRTMPAFQGASFLSAMIRDAGAEIWICTSRPYLRLDNIDPDTREWLRRNGIEYDAVLFDTISEKYSKYQELFRQAEEQVAAIVDDLPELIESATNLFPKTAVIVMDQPYNKQVEGIPRAEDCYDILDLVMPAINKWKLENWQ